MITEKIKTSTFLLIAFILLFGIAGIFVSISISKGMTKEQFFNSMVVASIFALSTIGCMFLYRIERAKNN